MPTLREMAEDAALKNLVGEMFSRIAPPKPRAVDVEALPPELDAPPADRPAIESLAQHLAAAAVICGVFLT